MNRTTEHEIAVRSRREFSRIAPSVRLQQLLLRYVRAAVFGEEPAAPVREAVVLELTNREMWFDYLLNLLAQAQHDLATSENGREIRDFNRIIDRTTNTLLRHRGTLVREDAPTVIDIIDYVDERIEEWKEEYVARTGFSRNLFKYQN